ncbi:MAG: cytidine deaminase [Kangiellaceae bacterium]|jgi:cytidine deaminase
MDNTSIKAQLKSTLKRAYSPYSTVKVAAAVEYEVDGQSRVAFGVNVENVSYGLTICAERSAISNAIVDGMTKVSAVYVMSNQKTPISPCGACRQVLTEFMHSADGPVECVNETLDKTWSSTLGDLLPNRFDL